MKKFNANGGYRKDAKKDINKFDLNSYNGQSLKETTESLDDTMLLSKEELEEINEMIKNNPEKSEIYK